MPERTELREIVERLGDGPSYALDVEIAQTFVPDIVVARQRRDDSGADPHTYRCFTTKVDDALWLAETLLPGAKVMFNNWPGGERPFAARIGRDGDDARAPTPAIALLIALFRALEGQKQ